MNDTTNESDSHPNDSNSNMILESLLQELSFWESPSTTATSMHASPMIENGTTTNYDTTTSSSTNGRDRNRTNRQRNSNNNNCNHDRYSNGTDNTTNGYNINIRNDPYYQQQQQYQNSSEYDNNTMMDRSQLYNYNNGSHHEIQQFDNGNSHQYLDDNNVNSNNADNDNTHLQNNNSAALQQQQQQQQQPIVGSPTLEELQANCFWNKAIDPASGRTYYYDIRTRQTQWEKPREIRMIEKRIKQDQRKQDELFFREMERNLLASLARGECIPKNNHHHSSIQQSQESEDFAIHNNSSSMNNAPITTTDSENFEYTETNDSIATNNGSGGRIRTISCMNEHLLAQIQLQQPIPLQRVNNSNISKSFEGRPPLPSRPTTTATQNTASIAIATTTTTLTNSMTTGTAIPSSNNTQQQQSNQQPYDSSNFVVTNNNLNSKTENLLPYDKNMSSSTINQQMYYRPPENDDDDDLKLSPEESQRKQIDDVLRGEDLLDGALILADLEVSDDEDGDGTSNDLECIDGTFVNSHGPTDSPLQMDEISPSNDVVQSQQLRIVSTTSRKVDSNGIAPLSHIRRNTAGEGSMLSSHMKGGTMEKPDIDGTIHVVCGVIRAHIEQSCQESRPSSTLPTNTNINLDIFRDDYEKTYNDSLSSQLNHPRIQHPQQKKVNIRSGDGTIPTLDEIKEFYREFYQRSQMEFDAIIMSLIYVERLIKSTNGALMPTPYNWASVVFSCMVLASKVWDDLSMWNIDFSNVSVNSGVLSSFSLKRINELELSVLACLNFAVAIPGSEYAKYYYLLRSMMIRGGLLDPFAASQQLSTATTNRLQDRTNHYQDSIVLHANDDNPRRRVRSVDWSS